MHLNVAAEEAAGMVVAGYFVEICLGCLHVELVHKPARMVFILTLPKFSR